MSLISDLAFQRSSPSQRHLKGAALYFVPTKDRKRLQKPRELSMGWNGCYSFSSALTLHRTGGQVGAFMSTALVIQERVTGSMMQILRLVFLKKIAIK